MVQGVGLSGPSSGKKILLYRWCNDSLWVFHRFRKTTRDDRFPISLVTNPTGTGLIGKKKIQDWVENDTPRSHKVIEWKPWCRGWVTSLWIVGQGSPGSPKTLKVAATAVFVCQNEEVSLIACCGCRQEEIKLGLNWKPLPWRLAFMVLEAAVQAAVQNCPQHSCLAVDPAC